LLEPTGSAQDFPFDAEGNLPECGDFVGAGETAGVGH
jgi:hypothetical protein